MDSYILARANGMWVKLFEYGEEIPWISDFLLSFGLGWVVSVFFLVFSVVFCFWELGLLSFTRRGVGGVFDKLEMVSPV